MSFNPPRNTRRVLALAASLLSGALLLSACSSGESTAPADGNPVSGGNLTWGIETEPSTLNPHLNGQDKVKLVLRNTFESLLSRKDDGGYVPWLADSYDVSADGTAYTFKLRQGVTFTDGTAFNAAAVIKNFERLKDPAYSSGTAAGPISNLDTAAAVDQYTVQLRLKSPYSPFLDYIAGVEIISPAAFESSDLKAGGPAVAGTGPFVLDRYAKGQEIHFVKNEKYNSAPKDASHQGPAYLDTVTYRILPESSVRLGALTSGQVDVIEGVSGNDAEVLRSNPDFNYATALNTGTPYSLFLNVENGPTKELAVRKALTESLDIDAVIKSVYKDQRTRAWGITSPIDPDYYDPTVEGSYQPDTEKANKRLDDAGWGTRDAEGFRTKDGKRLTIEVVQAQATVRDQRDVLLQALQAQAKQNAGIDLKISFVDAGTYTDRRKTGNFGSIANSNTPADGVDIEFHWYPVNAGGSINYSRASDPKLSEWLKAASATTDKATRKSNYSALQKFAITEQAYAIPLYEPEDQVASAKYVHGTSFRPFRQLPENAYNIWLSTK